MSDDLFIFAGEVSGDLHGEKLLKELYHVNPNLKVRGVGGPRMRKVGMECIMNMEEFQVMGFSDVLFSVPKLLKKFKLIKKDILNRPPKGVVTIDYPGFNLRLANALAKKSSPAKRIHYICPTVWAWGKGRIPKMEKNLDQLLTILPFEVDIFSKGLMQTEYVGHPLISRIAQHEYNPNWNESYGISKEQQILSTFPGSREKEIMRNFKTQLKVAKRIQKNHENLQIAVSCSDEKLIPLMKKEDPNLLIIHKNYSYELMRASHLAIATSGTVTLELALHQVPTVVTFSINPIDVFLAKYVFRINLPHFALPNILAKQEVFPELFGPHFTEEALYQKGNEFMISEYKRTECMEMCAILKTALGKKDASKDAARAIMQQID